MQKKKKSGKAGKIILALLCILLALVLVGMLAGMMLWERLLSGIQRVEGTVETLPPDVIASIENETDPIDENYTGDEIDPTEITWSTVPAETIGKEDHLINILLIGQDRRPGQGRQRSDSMILCTINKEKKTLMMTSFQRDTYVQIPGYQDNKMNAAYAFGGMPLLNKTLAVNFGVHVDGNVEVDFSGFKEIIDIMGGVRINLTKAEANWINRYGKYSVHAGENLLNGEEALNYARIRKLDNDFGRTNRQRKVLTQLLNQSRELDLAQFTVLLNKIMSIITTDMTNAQITGYALELFPLLKDLTITTQHIPAEGTYRNGWVRKMFVLLADMDKNRQILEETLR